MYQHYIHQDRVTGVQICERVASVVYYVQYDIICELSDFSYPFGYYQNVHLLATVLKTLRFEKNCYEIHIMGIIVRRTLNILSTECKLLFR